MSRAPLLPGQPRSPLLAGVSTPLPPFLPPHPSLRQLQRQAPLSTEEPSRARPFPAPGGGDSLSGPGDGGPVPLTRAGIPSAAGRGSRNWPRSARVAEAGRGEAGSFRCSAAGRQPRLEAVPTAGRGP